MHTLECVTNSNYVYTYVYIIIYKFIKCTMLDYSSPLLHFRPTQREGRYQFHSLSCSFDPSWWCSPIRESVSGGLITVASCCSLLTPRHLTLTHSHRHHSHAYSDDQLDYLFNQRDRLCNEFDEFHCVQNCFSASSKISVLPASCLSPQPSYQ